MSKTEENLMAAFAGESQARNMYTYFATVARKEGYHYIAKIFEETALNEMRHAKDEFVLAGKLGDTAANLEAVRERRPQALAGLRRLGLGSWVDAGNYPRPSRLVLRFPAGQTVQVEQGPELPSLGRVVPRRELDRALLEHTTMSAREVVSEALRIASGIDIYTNDHITIEELGQ